MKIKADDNINKICKYCENGFLLENSEKILCKKKGIVEPDYTCHRYKFDIFKLDFKHKRLNIKDLDLETLGE